ncbi:hypothetical protein BRC81_02035 [Halobacteriales archaeon QS_1_68_20]|nr:MAG: hypothetical protein BRC81_02035 [Halobacteriales archaeon QS_1_68_20]
MASDHVQNLLAGEAALGGEKREVNCVRFRDTLGGVFTRPESYPERHTGFAGRENLREQLDSTDFDADRVPDESDRSMGFDPLYENSVPRETNATIVGNQKLVEPAQKLARARFDLENRLTDDAEGLPTEERDDDLRGHDGDQELETVMLRRDIDTTDGNRPGVHFVGLMRFNGYMTYMRQAMNGVGFDTAAFGPDDDRRIQHDDVEVDQQDNGIANYLTTRRRGNFPVPPISLRALPHPRAHEATVDVRRDGDAYVVTVDAVEGGGRLDSETVRFGHYRAVNRGGTAPATVSRKRGTLTFEFPADGTGLDDGGRARLFGNEQGTRRPVTGTADLSRQDENGKGEEPDRPRMEPGRVVEDAELRSAVVVTPLLLVLLLTSGFGTAPVAAAVGLVFGPVVTSVKNVLIRDEFRQGAFVLLVVGLVGGLAFVGYLVELLWLLVGYNVGTAAVGLYERRVRPLVGSG